MAGISELLLSFVVLVLVGLFSFRSIATQIFRNDACCELVVVNGKTLPATLSNHIIQMEEFHRIRYAHPVTEANVGNLPPFATASGLPQTGRSPSNAEPAAAAQI